MGEKCVTLSAVPGHLRICETDDDGRCTKNCRDVKIEDLHPRVAIEFKRLNNAVAKYT